MLTRRYDPPEQRLSFLRFVDVIRRMRHRCTGAAVRRAGREVRAGRWAPGAGAGHRTLGVGRTGTPDPRRSNALDPVALYGPCRDGGLDKGTLAMTLSGLRGRARALPVPPDQRTGHRPYQVHHS